MARAYDELVLSDTELLTSLGLDKGERRAAKYKLSDRSAAYLAAMQDTYRQALRDLKAIDRNKLSGMDAINYDSALAFVDVSVYSYDHFDYGTYAWLAPYTVSQLTGSYREIPDFLVNQHSVASKEDAEAYLARLSDFAVQFDNETARLKAERGLGVTPPDYVVERSLEQYDGLTKAAPAGNSMTRALVDRTAAKNIAGDWAARAAKIVETAIYPAMRRQADFLRSGLADAVHDAGVSRLPEGEA